MSSLSLQSLFSLTGRNVAITGGASGIGRMLAIGMAYHGCKVTIIDRNEEGLKQTIQEVLKESPKSEIVSITGDLSTEAGIKKIVSDFKAKNDSLDHLIQCAGLRPMNQTSYQPGGDLESLQAAVSSASWDAWDLAFKVNVFAPYFLTAGLIDLLGQSATRGAGRGSVVLFTSAAGQHNDQFVPAYQLSKAALNHLIRVLASEFRDFYVRVNAISPGLVASAMNPDEPGNPLNNNALCQYLPAQRVTNIEDLVGTCVWLSSQAGSFVDGTIVDVTGGRMLGLKKKGEPLYKI